MTKKSENLSVNMVFDHITIRRFIGSIAILLPLLVIIAARSVPDSISASYYLDVSPILPYFPSPHDIFVGSLFVIGAFLMSYKGHHDEIAPGKVEAFWRMFGQKGIGFRIWEHRHEEDIVSWFGGGSAWIVALCPTAKPAECVQALLFSLQSETSKLAATLSTIHLSFATIVFLSTVYFCLVAFKRKLKEKFEQRGTAGPWYSDPLQYRRFIYNLSGWATLFLLAALAVSTLVIRDEIRLICNQTYWAETIMLELFGVAWFTASKPFFLRDASEKTQSGRTSSE